MMGLELVEIHGELSMILRSEAEKLVGNLKKISNAGQIPDFNFDRRTVDDINQGNLEVNGRIWSNQNAAKLTRQNNFKLPAMSIQDFYSSSDSSFSLFMNFPSYFEDLKEGFTIYSLLAGNSLLAIMIYAGIAIFQVIAEFTFKQNEVAIADHMTELIIACGIMIFLAIVGEYLRAQVTSFVFQFYKKKLWRIFRFA